jgi:hypothetical protein
MKKETKTKTKKKAKNQKTKKEKKNIKKRIIKGEKESFEKYASIFYERL